MRSRLPLHCPAEVGTYLLPFSRRQRLHRATDLPEAEPTRIGSQTAAVGMALGDLPDVVADAA